MRSGDDGPFAAIFMLGLMLAVAGGAIWYSIRYMPGEPASLNNSKLSPESRPRPGGSPTRFVDAFKRLPNDAVALQKAADAEYDNAARSLGVSDRAEIDKILGRNARSRDAYTDAELAFLRRHGFGTWVRAKAINWAQSDPAFTKVGEAVWNRSSQARDDALLDLAAKWGEMSRSARLELYQAIQAVEGKSRELTGEERAAVVAFAGEDYLANRD
jgi:hypothetical protein